MATAPDITSDYFSTKAGGFALQINCVVRCSHIAPFFFTLVLGFSAAAAASAN
jgi:hypothetical protein